MAFGLVIITLLLELLVLIGPALVAQSVYRNKFLWVTLTLIGVLAINIGWQSLTGIGVISLFFKEFVSYNFG